MNQLMNFTFNYARPLVWNAVSSCWSLSPGSIGVSMECDTGSTEQSSKMAYIKLLTNMYIQLQLSNTNSNQYI
jgi:hypothetical protein